MTKRQERYTRYVVHTHESKTGKMLTALQVFDYFTATLGLPVELPLQEESQNEGKPFPRLSDKICFRVKRKSYTLFRAAKANQHRLGPSSVLETIGTVAPIS